MNLSDPQHRHEELDAGRALGNLDLEELREFDSLERSHGFARDTGLDLLAASLEVEAALRSAQPMPAALAKRLHRLADETQPASARTVIRPEVSAWKRMLAHPSSGWLAAAAAIALAFILPRVQTDDPPEIAATRLRAESKDVIERNFAGLGDFKSAGGSVIWSDSKQQGYMILSGIPANDPGKAQYQLWIVDPARDTDAPVDGGVFDIPAGAASVVVPIDAKLAIRNPQAFVITREQPGGVVKSKQETVVALAKN
jgi:anti-sigma-K factor RskA